MMCFICGVLHNHTENNWSYAILADEGFGNFQAL